MLEQYLRQCVRERWPSNDLAQSFPWVADCDDTAEVLRRPRKQRGTWVYLARVLISNGLIEQVADPTRDQPVAAPCLARRELKGDCAEASVVSLDVSSNQLLDHLGSCHGGLRRLSQSISRSCPPVQTMPTLGTEEQLAAADRLGAV